MMLRGALLAICASMLACGCVSQARYDQARAELDKCELSRVEMQRERDEVLETQKQLEKQVETLQALGEKRIELLYTVEHIDLGRHTGGVNLDGEPGDDGVRVYLQPIDEQGHILKAAGSVKIDVFDLAGDPQDNLISSCSWDVEQTAKQWAGGFVSYQYAFDCPWPDGPPAHDEITVRVEFVDYLTGKTFSAQKAFKVTMPPE